VGGGAGGRAKGGYEGTVEVVYEIERGQERLGGEAEGGVGEGGEGEGCGREWVEVRCEEEGEGGGEFHHDPGLDAIDREDAVGRGKPAKGRIVDEGDGAEEGERTEEPLFGCCAYNRICFLRDVNKVHVHIWSYLYTDNQSRSASPGQSTLPSPSTMTDNVS